jgi:hypothetical protein
MSGLIAYMHLLLIISLDLLEANGIIKKRKIVRSASATPKVKSESPHVKTFRFSTYSPSPDPSPCQPNPCPTKPVKKSLKREISSVQDSDDENLEVVLPASLIIHFLHQNSRI